jgi:hypothetical protein
MKSVFALAAMCLALAASTTLQPREDSGLPELHKIKSVTLSPSYSCRSEEDFQKGYENTALFLSGYSRLRRSPELLFNGACESAGYLQGHDLDVMADLGELPLEQLRPDQILKLTSDGVNYSRFSAIARPPVAGHTYAELINQNDIRGFFYFQVTAYVPGQRLELKYVVEQYELFKQTAASGGNSGNRE